jgi:hypothetical protein
VNYTNNNLAALLRTKPNHTGARVMRRVARWFLFEPKIQIYGQILEGLRWEYFDIFFDLLE